MQPPSVEPPRSHPVTGTLARGGKPRVLVAEDDADMRSLLAWMLEKEGYEVVAASDGVDLLRRILATTWGGPTDAFDAIVADINMPDLTAFEVLAGVRCNGFSTPIVLITASKVSDVGGQARDIRPAAILEKPLDWHALWHTLRQLISGRRQR